MFELPEYVSIAKQMNKTLKGKGIKEGVLGNVPHRFVWSGVDVMQTTYLTPLPGTRLFDMLKEEGRLLYTDFPSNWVKYDMTEVIHHPLMLKPHELEIAMAESNQRIYNRRTLYRKFLKTWIATRDLTTALWAYSSNSNYRNLAMHPSRRRQ